MPGPLRGPSAVESRLCTDHIRRDQAQDSAAEWDSLRVWDPENADPPDHAQPRRDEGGMLGEAHHQASHAAADAAATALSPLWVGGPCQPLSKKHNHIRGVYIPTRLVSLKKVLTGWRLVRKLQCAGGVSAGRGLHLGPALPFAHRPWFYRQCRCSPYGPRKTLAGSSVRA